VFYLGRYRALTIMKLLFFIIVIFLSSCGTIKKENQNSVINKDSLAFYQIEETDPYWDFSKFILEFPESDYLTEALTKYYQKKTEYYKEKGPGIHECWSNCAIVRINTNREIEYENELINSDYLVDSLVVFFSNSNDIETLASKKDVKDVNGKNQKITKGYIELQYVKDSCDNLQNVIIEINHSLLSYKDVIANNWYEKTYTNLTNTEKTHLDSLLQYTLRLNGWDKFPPSPPSPPSNL